MTQHEVNASGGTADSSDKVRFEAIEPRKERVHVDKMVEGASRQMPPVCSDGFCSSHFCPAWYVGGVRWMSGGSWMRQNNLESK